MSFDLHTFLLMAGILQIALSIGSLAIPKLLNFKGALGNVSTLIKQMFWNYAAYILFINLFFGIITILGANELLHDSVLAKGLALLMFLYWLARILVQLFYFDTKNAPTGPIYKLGEWVLMGLFVFFTFAYGWLCFHLFV